MNFYKLVLVGVGGMLGSVARYVVASSIDRKLNAVFPYGTFTVNILGSFILGFLYGWVSGKAGSNENIRLLIGAGFCGGFTTFSTFAFENVSLLQQKLMGTSILYVSLSLVAGFLAVAAGMLLGKSLT